MATSNLKQAAQKESEALRIDFDQAVKEAQAKAIVVRFDGRDYTLPARAPAWIPLFVAERQKGGILDDADNMELVRGLLGSDFVSKIVDERHNFVSLEAVNSAIIIPVMSHWGIRMDEPKKKKATPGS